MMSFFRVFLIFLLTLTLITACGGNKKLMKKEKPSDLVEVVDPFDDLTVMSNKIVESGGIAAVGEGTSVRRDIAKEKARVNAQAKLAEIFNLKVQRLKKTFVEEVGTANESEVNESFSTVTKTLTSQIIKGAIVKKTKITKNTGTGQYMVGVIIAITPKTVDMSIMKKLETSRPQLYQRFRASKAYEELKKEMDEYEKKDAMR